MNTPLPTAEAVRLRARCVLLAMRIGSAVRDRVLSLDVRELQMLQRILERVLMDVRR